MVQQEGRRTQAPWQTTDFVSCFHPLELPRSLYFQMYIPKGMVTTSNFNKKEMERVFSVSDDVRK